LINRNFKGSGFVLAVDNSTSPPALVELTHTNPAVGLPNAVITNLVDTWTNATVNGSSTPLEVYPVLQSGLYPIGGTASSTNGQVCYGVYLYPPGNLTNAFANITPGPLNANGLHMGGVTNGSLGSIDVSLVPNGVYDLALEVFAGGLNSNYIVRVTVDSQLKLGQFTFTEQDMVIPVAGIPITVTRTYNSINTVQGDFGYNWNYTVNDMNVQLDEDRSTATAIESFGGTDDSSADGADVVFSLRTGGGRNVSLTLPDGRRTTFQFGYASESADLNGVAGVWTAPPGIYASLTTLQPNTNSQIGDNSLVFLSGLAPYWNGGGPSEPMDAHDFPGFVLTTQDGTAYTLMRDPPGTTASTYNFEDAAGQFGAAGLDYYITPHSGQPKVVQITERTGDILSINPGGVSHQNASGVITRSITFDRDSQNRIVGIHDPLTGPNGFPIVQYVYDQTSGNLVQVLKLTNSVTGTYTTNLYHYDSLAFPHYITEIDAPTGAPVRSSYDTSGRLIQMVDANDHTNSFLYNISGQVETNIDRLGNTNIYGYDTHGNITNLVNALGQVSTYAFDTNNNKTFENLGGLQTNTYVYDTNSFMLQSVIGGIQTNTFTYDPYGHVLSSVDGRGNWTSNTYDQNTGNLLSTVTALSTNSFVYDTLGRQIRSTDPLGNYSTSAYDGYDDVTNAVSFNAAGTNMSSSVFSYDMNGNRLTNSVRRTTATGMVTNDVTSYVYDSQNRLVQTIDPDGLTNSVSYNSLGRQAANTDKLGRVTSYAYDNVGNLASVTHPDNTLDQYFYDAENHRTNSIDRIGRTNQVVFDSLGRQFITIMSDMVSSNVTLYDAAGRVSQTIDARGVTNAFGYDAAGRKTSTTAALGTALQMLTTYAYDVSGNQTNMVDALNHTNTYVFDALNRQTMSIFPDGTTILDAYDASSRRASETDQATNTTSFGYDGLGRLTSVTNALGKRTQYGWDETGNQTSQVDALGRATVFKFDSLGQRVSRVLPAGQIEGFVYDGVGNTLQHTNFNGQVITNTYDSMNRLLGRWCLGTNLESYMYDADSEMTNRWDGAGSNFWTFDMRGRVTLNVTPVGKLTYTYDGNGNLTSLVSGTSGGVSLSYQYDALNRLTNAGDQRLSGSTNTVYAYDGVGNLLTYKYPNGVTNLWQYDNLNRLTNAAWKSGSTALASFFYHLGPNGTRASLSDTVTNTSRSFTWSYDTTYRLATEVVGGTTPTGTVGYQYDTVGNRTNLTSTLSGISATNNNFDVNDWLDIDTNTLNSSAWFDLNGNERTNGTSVYLYDWANRLTNANSASIIIWYDANGNRIKKVTTNATTLYLVATVNPTGYPQVVEESSVTGSTTNLVKSYTYGLSLISQRAISGGAINFYGCDGLGTVRFLTDTNANITDTYAYDAFGNLVASSIVTTNNYRFTAQQLDPDLNLYYNRARYMNPATGRFMTMDSYEGSQDNPSSIHKFGYCFGNPVNRIDPTGHDGDLTSLMIAISIALIISPDIANAPGPHDQTYSSAGGVDLCINIVGGQIIGRYIVGPALNSAFKAVGYTGRHIGGLFVPRVAGVGGGAPSAQLSASVSAAFNRSVYIQSKLTAPLRLWRAQIVAGNAGRGNWFATSKPTSMLDAEIKLNINKYGSPRLILAEYEMPANTVVYKGQVAGGIGEQLYVDDINAAVLVNEEPLPIFDTVSPIYSDTPPPGSLLDQ
jgi:RHS repeat-associated protein